MTKLRSIIILPILAFTFALVFIGQSAQADWSVSFQGEVDRSYGSYSGDRLTSEYRRGYQVDDWVERGASSVTDSPLFSDGIRLASWATGYEEDYEYGLASAIYFFEVPSRSRSVRIKIYYEGEADRGDLDEDIAGRVWIRRTNLGDDFEEYYPSGGRYEDVDEPLYGDTFVLQARKHLEILRLSTDDYVDDGMMELHVVAEGSQRIDVKYIEVETYSYAPRIRVITRYYRDYTWRPWNHYAYWYFYTGPTYYFGDYYYVRYTYPDYHRHYMGIRVRFNDYLSFYYSTHPRYHYVRWTYVARVHRGTHRVWNRNRLNKWTSNYSEARKRYVVTSTKRRSAIDVQKSRTSVRSVLSSRSQRSPSTIRAQSGKIVRTPSRRRTTSVQTRNSGTTDVKRRTTTPDVRRGTDRSRTFSTGPTRIETQSSTKSRHVETRTPVRTRSSSTSSRRESESNIRRTPTRTTPQQQRTPPSSGQVKTRRESTSSRRSETRRTEPQRTAPARKVEVKKDDDDDDDEKSNNSQVKTRSTSSSRSSSTKTRRTR